MNKTILRMAVKDIFTEAFENAGPASELTAKALREDWDSDDLNSALADLIDKQLLDLTKTFDYYVDKIMDLLESGDAS